MLTINVNGGNLKFGKGAKPKAVCKNGWSSRTAKIKLADGSVHDGMVVLCDQDSGEHYGTGIYLTETNDMTFQDDPDFLDKLGRTSEQVFPYKYKYHGSFNDIHVDAHGWS